MKIPDGHFRHILLYNFRKGKNAVQARKKLYYVYGEKSLKLERLKISIYLYCLKAVKMTAL